MEYQRARQAGNFIENKLKVMDSDKTLLVEMEANVKLEQSEGMHSDTSAMDEATYESEPVDTKLDYKNLKRRHSSEEEWIKQGIKRRIVELSDEQFEELMHSELESRRNVKKRIARKLVLKRLQPKSRRNSRRTSIRKVETSTEDDDTDDTMLAEDSDKDVKNQIDDLLAEDYGQETVPVKWQDRAKSLNENERKVLAGKLTSAIDEMSKGNGYSKLFTLILLLIQMTLRLQPRQRTTPWERTAKTKVRCGERNLQELMTPILSGRRVKKKATENGCFINSNIFIMMREGISSIIIMDDSYVQGHLTSHGV